MNHTKSKVKMVLKFVTIFVAVIVAGVGGIATATYFKLNSSVKTADVEHYYSQEKKAVDPTDPNAGLSLNYVLIGSDSREGAENHHLGGGDDGGMRSDTTIIVHISADRKRVDLVSIPRDSIVTIPACKREGLPDTTPQEHAMFNSAFSKGNVMPSAIGCTIATIVENTGLYIDGYAVVDFSGFKNVVDSLGGVKYNVPYDMVSKKAHLNLKKGEQTLNGTQALAFARSRTFEVGGGDGSDLSRIKRQQDLLGAVAKQILSSDTMSDPDKVLNVSESVLKSMTVSKDLGSVTNLAGFALSLKDLDRSNINFYTVPNMPWPADANRVVWTDKAKAYWSALKNDDPIVDKSVADKKAKTVDPTSK